MTTSAAASNCGPSKISGSWARRQGPGARVAGSPSEHANAGDRAARCARRPRAHGPEAGVRRPRRPQAQLTTIGQRQGHAHPIRPATRGQRWQLCGQQIGVIAPLLDGMLVPAHPRVAIVAGRQQFVQTLLQYRGRQWAAPWPITQARSTRAARPGDTWRSSCSESTRGATSRWAISSASSSSSRARVCPQCIALPANAAAACGQRWRSNGSTCRRRKLRSAWSWPLLGSSIQRSACWRA